MGSRRWVGRLSALVLVAASLGFVPPASASDASGPASAPGQLLVGYRVGTTDSERADARSQAGARLLQRVARGDANRAEVELVATSRGAVQPQAQHRFTSNPHVAYAEPNWVLTKDATSIDPYYTDGSLWGMYGTSTSPANPYGSGAGVAWASGATGSSAVYVGVIDEGIQYTHPDLDANVWTNQFDPINNVDDDHNGYIDDVHGWDFFHKDNTVYDAGEDAHGTHVSGTIGAKSNSAGVVGVNWNVTLISGKFLGPNGGYTSDAVSAVDYMTQLKVAHGMNLVALNNSWGGGGYSQSLHDAIIRAAKANILFVAAAGNSGTDNDNRASYPSNYNTAVGTSTEAAASYDSVIAVAAIDSSGNKPSWSSYGANTVDLGAPGVGIWSTVPTNTYASYSGTSMATPHVTGAAALYKSMNTAASAPAIKTGILSTTTATTSMSGTTVTGGRLNIAGFVSVAPPPLPGTPTTLSATAVSSSQINLTWGASTNASSYVVDRSPDGVNGWVQIATPTTTAYNDTGLSASTSYWYRVKARNSTGDSSYSSSVSATTPAAPTPQAPINLTAVPAGGKGVQLGWTAPDPGSSPITNYKLYRSGGSASVVISLGNITSYKDTSTTRGTSYTYQVSAVSAVGEGPKSATATAIAK